MSFANTSYSDILSTAIESRSKKLADNVTKNNVLFSRLEKKGNIRTFSGGSSILEELSFQANGNFGWYSGYDLLPVAAQDVISSASYSIKQCATPVVISGLEMLENSGEEKMIDLMEGRLKVAEATMANNMSAALYSDGSGYGGKQMIGLLTAVNQTPTSGTYGGIDRATWSFWQNQKYDPAVTPTASTIQGHMNALWSTQVRGKDRPDLIILDNVLWGLFTSSLQALQRFTDAGQADLGFPSQKFLGTDVVLDGGIGGYCPTSVGYFLNTDYLFLRPHKDRNMVSLSPTRRVAINQDAEVEIISWAGNLTCSGAQFQGVYIGT